MGPHRIPTLLFSSIGIPGLIQVNGALMGELTQNTEQSLSIPVSPFASCYISFIPLVGDYLQETCDMITRKLVFAEGLLLDPELPEMRENMSILEWPNNLYEIILQPNTHTTIPICSPIPKVIHQIAGDFTGDKQQKILTLFKDQCLHLVIEEPNHDNILFDYTPDMSYEVGTLSSQDITGNGISDILLKGPAEDDMEYLIIFSYQSGHFQIIFDDSAHTINLLGNTPVHIQTLHRIYDTVEHGTLEHYTYNEDIYSSVGRDIIWYHGQPQWPQKPLDTAKALVEAVRIGEYSEAKGYLSQNSYNSTGSIEQNIELGNFLYWVEPRIHIPEETPDKVFLGLVYENQIHHEKVCLYEFSIVEEPTLQGLYKVSHIQKLSL